MTEQQLVKIFNTKQNRTNQLQQVFSDFENNIIPEIAELITNYKSKNANVFEMYGADKPALYNQVSRVFNTKLGYLWENIAVLSSNVISPEKELGFRLPNVDCIVYYDNKLYYTQLKTQKNTLTGSHGPEVIRDLTSYPNHWFVACLDNNSSWTAPASLNRLVGSEFWSKIGINYIDIDSYLQHIVNKLDSML